MVLKRIFRIIKKQALISKFPPKKQAKIVKTISAQTKSIDLILISRHYPLIEFFYTPPPSLLLFK
jgi:hypothetical protein